MNDSIATPKRHEGKLTLICGPMFSGKTTMLRSIAHVYAERGAAILYFVPKESVSLEGFELVSQHQLVSEPIPLELEYPDEFLSRVYASHADAIFFDDIHMFAGDKIVYSIDELVETGHQIVTAGLMYDYQRLAFEGVVEIEARASDRQELFSFCERCGGLARFTERVVGGTARIEPGGSESYMPVCESCHRMFI